jgi:hypothetical protein
MCLIVTPLKIAKGLGSLHRPAKNEKEKEEIDNEREA